MSIVVRKNKAQLNNTGTRQDTTPIELKEGTTRENMNAPGGQVGVDEDGNPVYRPNYEFSAYHQFSLREYFSGRPSAGGSGVCPSPYSRQVDPQTGEVVSSSFAFQDRLIQREELLLQATGRTATLLRRKWTGPRCPKHDRARGRSRANCPICFGTSFVGGYAVYQNPRESLGRILIRFDSYPEDVVSKETGLYIEQELSGWTLPSPIIRDRDILIIYDEKTGLETYRYEVLSATRNDTLFGETGAQRLNIKLIDPSTLIYKFDQFNLVDLADVFVKLPMDTVADNDGLGAFPNQWKDDGALQNEIESLFGDGNISGMYAEAYKLGYENNFRRAVNFRDILVIPDFDEDGILASDDPSDGIIVDGYGPGFEFTDVNGNPINFANIDATDRRNFVQGFYDGAQDGYNDGIRHRIRTGESIN